ncbi:tetratricopeptide repeat protein [Leptospira venezuelensis]|uniref:tetratricopeptide repeat protein n=1 Tax=Leptospira venezuelensis TaxID=1958811 RepID=UPI000A3D56FE|nr:tetratricopeptide repeat protein [Leptospira venezuelensis]
MKNKYLVFLICFLFVLEILGDTIPEDYPEIKRVLESGNVNQAQDMLDPLLQSKPSDPTLALYQAEIWIRKAETYYQEGRKLSSFEFFKKAYEVWPNHNLVRTRYWELQGKKLKDSVPKANGNYGSINNTGKGNNAQKTVFVFDPELQELSAELRQEMKKNIAELQELRAASEDTRSWSRWIWLSAGAIIGFGLGIVTSVFRRK